jgi:hypothetical protein
MMVCPSGLYRRNCERGNFGDELALLQSEGVDGLDPDLIHMEYIGDGLRAIFR